MMISWMYLISQSPSRSVVRDARGGGEGGGGGAGGAGGEAGGGGRRAGVRRRPVHCRPLCGGPVIPCFLPTSSGLSLCVIFSRILCNLINLPHQWTTDPLVPRFCPWLFVDVACLCHLGQNRKENEGCKICAPFVCAKEENGIFIT